MKKQELEALQHDQFVDTVAASAEYVRDHQKRVGFIALAVVIAAAVGGGIYYYLDSQATARQKVFQAALDDYNAPIGAAQSPFQKTFPTEQARQDAAKKQFNDVISQYGSSPEGAYARYYLGVMAADAGNLNEAAKMLEEAAKNGSEDAASLAKLTLADVRLAQGQPAEAEKLLQYDYDHPTALVSKDLAALNLSRILAKRDLAKAKALLEPLKNSKSTTVSRQATAALSELGSSAGK